MEKDSSTILVCLGKNWQQKRASRQTGIFTPSLDTARTAIACGEKYLSGEADAILFSTGHTLEHGPSEAEAMKLQLRTQYSEDEIPDKDIFLEEESIDTPGNAEMVAKKLLGTNKQIDLVTVRRHAFRAEKLFTSFEVPIRQVYASEDILRARGFSTENSFPELLCQTGDALVEKVLTALLRIDPYGHLPRLITQKIRH